MAASNARLMKRATFMLLSFILIVTIFLILNDPSNDDERMDNLQVIKQFNIEYLSNYTRHSKLHTKIIPKYLNINQSTTTTNANIRINKNIPSSWIELNNQQFCSIHPNTNQQSVIERIHSLQFTQNCSHPLTKFLIYDIALEATRGLGASLYGWLVRYMVVAMQTNRILLWHGQFDWTQNVSYCANKNAMECYFMPLSHCNPMNILSTINRSDTTQYYEGNNPKHCVFGSNNRFNNLSQCMERVIFINKKPQKPLLQRPISEFAQRNFRMKIFEFEAILVSFFLRPQPMVKHIIYKKINKSLYNSLHSQITAFNASQYISLPIRASDKCKNIQTITHKQYTHMAEVTCFTPFEYVKLMNVMREYSDNELRGVIITSEDALFVQDVINVMQYENVSNVSDWNIILNTEDFSVGEGTTTYKRTQIKYNASLREGVRTSLETDNIISAMSSLLLQLHFETEYLLWLYESSWTEMMWNWLAVLNCNVNKTKHVADKNKCVKLLNTGYIHKRKHNGVEFSEDIWKKLKRENVSEQEFYDKHGVWYKSNSFCSIAGSKNRIAK